MFAPSRHHVECGCCQSPHVVVQLLRQWILIVEGQPSSTGWGDGGERVGCDERHAVRAPLVTYQHHADAASRDVIRLLIYSLFCISLQNRYVQQVCCSSACRLTCDASRWLIIWRHRVEVVLRCFFLRNVYFAGVAAGTNPINNIGNLQFDLSNVISSQQPTQLIINFHQVNAIKVQRPNNG